MSVSPSVLPAPPAVLAILGRGVCDPGSTVVRADDAGLTRGDGCFEGCRVVDGRIAKLDAHLARMRRSAAALDIAFDEPAWRDLVATALAEWASDDEAAAKLVLTRGPAGGEPVGFVTVTALGPDTARLRADGLRVITLERGYAADAFADAPWLLGGVKLLSYAVNMAAQREADRRGADDAIFVSSDGLVLEAPTASVVWADGRQLSTTPTGDTGILAGTTQRLLFDRAAAAGWRTRYVTARVDELHAADVVWLVSTVRGPVDIVELDGTARARRPETTAEIRALAGF